MAEQSEEQRSSGHHRIVFGILILLVVVAFCGGVILGNYCDIPFLKNTEQVDDSERDPELEAAWENIKHNPLARGLFGVDSKEDLRRVRDGFQGTAESMDQAKRAREERQRKSEETRKKEIQERTVSLRGSFTFDGIEVTPTKVEVKKVRATMREMFGGTKTPAEFQDKVFVLSCNITNRSEGQVFYPVTRDTLRSCKVKDNYNNEMEPLVENPFGTDRWEVDGRELKEIKPGETLEALFVHEKPKVERAGSYVWTLYLISNNKMRFERFDRPLEQAVFVNVVKSDIIWR